MRITIKIIAVFLLVLLLLAFSTQILLNSRSTSLFLTKQINKYSDRHVDISGVRWHWLPVPHLSLVDVNIEDPALVAAIPEVSIQPDWIQLAKGNLNLGSIYLLSPDVHIRALPGKEKKTLEKEGEKESPTRNMALPFPEIQVKDGRLVIDSKVFPEKARKGSKLFNFSEINGFLRKSSGSIRFDISCASRFFDKITLNGAAQPDGWTYRVDTGFKGLKLDLLLKEFDFNHPLYPVQSEADLRIRLEGTGSERMSASVRGSFPCYVIKSHNRDLLFSCGSLSLNLEKKGGDFTVKIAEMRFQEPQFNLNGEVSRHYDPGLHKDVWDIDLHASDVDVLAVRKRILALWGNHSVARKVCSIVKGGRVTRARYSFHGPVEDFRHLEAMKISADVKEAPIHVPGAELELELAKGPITIENGVLSGTGLSARLGNSLGTNGTLVLGLTGPDPDFNLDLMIDADLKDLPSVLHRLVKKALFRQELEKFSEIDGRAKGRLRIGEKLHDLSVYVDVTDIDASAKYDRISWPLHIAGGSLKVTPSGIYWEKIKGNAGPQIIHELTGKVNWKGVPLIGIENLDCSLDTGALFHELMGFDGISKHVSSVVSSVDGNGEIKGFHLEGPVKNPASWRYSFKFLPDSLVLFSPLLPGKAEVKKGTLELTDSSIVFKTPHLKIDSSAVAFHGHFSHAAFRNWKGDVMLTGIIGRGVANWIKEKGWIPPPYFPKIPCRVDKFFVAWDDNRTKVRGKISRDNPKGGGRVSTDLDLTVRQGKLDIEKIVVNGLGKRAEMGLSIHGGRNESIEFSWDGELLKSSLDALLENNELLEDSLTGRLRLFLKRGQGEKNTASGAISAKGVIWHWGVAKPVLIKDAFLRGDGDKIYVDKLVMGFEDEVISSTGFGIISNQGIKLSLFADSPSITWDNFSDFFAKDSSLGQAGESADNSIPATAENSDEYQKAWPFYGTFDFSLGKFSIQAHKFSDADFTSSNKMYTWAPVIGRFTIEPSGTRKLVVSRGEFCGLDTTGEWELDTKRCQIRVSTHEGNPRFENVLACLGYDQDIIEGPFSLDFRLSGSIGSWDSGGLHLYSDGGVIRRLNFFSKLFTVINVIDLFSKQGVSDLVNEGFTYSRLVLEGDIKGNLLKLDKFVVKGSGLNIFGRGTVDINTFEGDLILLVAPLKTIDTIISKVPLVGRVIGGKNNAVLTIPVGVKGNLSDPKVVLLPPEAVGSALIGLVTDTLKLPFIILKPVLPR